MMGGVHWLRGWREEWSRWKRTGASTRRPSPAPCPHEVLWGGGEAGGLAFPRHSGAPSTFSGPMAKQRASCPLWDGEIEAQRGRRRDPEPHSKTCQPTSPPAPTQTDRHPLSSLCLSPHPVECCAVHTPRSRVWCQCPLTSSWPGARSPAGRGANSGDRALLPAPGAVTSKFTRFQSHLLGREPGFLTQPRGLPRVPGGAGGTTCRPRHHLAPLKDARQPHTLGVCAPASRGTCWPCAAGLKGQGKGALPIGRLYSPALLPGRSPEAPIG